MHQMPLKLTLVAGILAIAGCGGTANPLPPDSNTAEYAQRSGDKMKSMYGVPKPSTKRAQSPADMMKSMYGNSKAQPGGSR